VGNDFEEEYLDEPVEEQKKPIKNDFWDPAPASKKPISKPSVVEKKPVSTVPAVQTKV
jgi:hypothetical protein